MKTVVAFSSKNRLELTKQSIKPLLDGQHALIWLDGSTDPEALTFFEENRKYATESFGNIKGGADAAVAFAFTTMLNHPNGYEVVGLLENDTLLDPGWFEPTMRLFDIADNVGVVTPRVYEDRVLFSCEGYAVLHNSGFGVQCLTREAAQIVLRHARTGFTTENRRIFSQLAGVDITPYWAFRANDGMITWDWHNEAVLAAHGLMSLGLVPSPVEMIGQVPPLEQQGLTLAKQPIKERIDPKGFALYQNNLARIRAGEFTVSIPQRLRNQDGGETIFAHQIAQCENAKYEGSWIHKNTPGYGPFSREAKEKGASVEAEVYGTCEFLVSAQAPNVQVRVQDLLSGYSVEPVLPPTGQVMRLTVPSSRQRLVRLTMLSAGACFHSLNCREPQPSNNFSFDWSVLPPVE